MNELPSPDQPAFICYLIVLVFGMLVGVAYINQLLDSCRSRWGFLKTWLLFLAHIPIPLLLFWFLDYTNAIRDTSVFAALLIAVGYRQIFAGGVQGIVMPGQTPALWKPFEAWVVGVREHISSKQIVWRDRFNEKLRDHLSNDATRLSLFRQLAFKHSKDMATLEQAIQSITTRGAPAGVDADAWQRLQASYEANALLQELRASFPDYGWFLKQQGLITRWQYNAWLGNRRAVWTAWGVGVVFLVLTMLATVWFFKLEPLQEAYYQWRFQKMNTTDKDRFRTQQFFRARFDGFTNHVVDCHRLLQGLLSHLRYKEIPPRLTRDALQIVMTSHNCSHNASIMPQLIEAVRTDNAPVRLLVHDTLKHLQTMDYATCKPGTNLVDWKPQQDVPLTEIDERARAWKRWWLGATNCCESSQ